MAEGRGQKYFGSVKLCPISREPTAWPSLLDEAAACLPRKGHLRDAGDDEGIRNARDRGQHHEQHHGGTNDRVHVGSSSDQMRELEAHVDELDPDERNRDAAEPVDQQIPTQQHRRAERPVFHALQRERNQEHDDHAR